MLKFSSKRAVRNLKLFNFLHSALNAKEPSQVTALSKIPFSLRADIALTLVRRSSWNKRGVHLARKTAAESKKNQASSTKNTLTVAVIWSRNKFLQYSFAGSPSEMNEIFKADIVQKFDFDISMPRQFSIAARTKKLRLNNIKTAVGKGTDLSFSFMKYATMSGF